MQVCICTYRPWENLKALRPGRFASVSPDPTANNKSVHLVTLGDFQGVCSCKTIRRENKDVAGQERLVPGFEVIPVVGRIDVIVAYVVVGIMQDFVWYCGCGRVGR